MVVFTFVLLLLLNTYICISIIIIIFLFFFFVGPLLLFVLKHGMRKTRLHLPFFCKRYHVFICIRFSFFFFYYLKILQKFVVHGLLKISHAAPKETKKNVFFFFPFTTLPEL